ncbi:hypothetical protein HADU_03993 [Acinetobacter sp. HA]|uniref:carboxypeptidase regulatory-like domain-containing protein n=1 Tax=Acinetobacter TaxID=469 RepID=UPI000263DEB4|nr:MULTISPECIES: carboxypeptidase regulatory-like domain-containing protein [Acinetobacter]EIM39987.1 hypothetical protein HADU_03993 [Acinetobacter sp. HA]MBB4836805.1 hypothetical protein [Acinetobacter schindleri]WBX36762.1 carboxypeptidase regulatory-like domain-containing protein [Acinetobacter schindleri]
MALKIFRVFWGDYVADDARLKQLGYKVLKFPRPIITALNADQGFGQIKGRVRKSGIGLPNLEVVCFKKETNTLLWRSKTDKSGFYKFRNIAVNLECFVTVFDPETGAWTKDRLIVK